MRRFAWRGSKVRFTNMKLFNTILITLLSYQITTREVWKCGFVILKIWEIAASVPVPLAIVDSTTLRGGCTLIAMTSKASMSNWRMTLTNTWSAVRSRLSAMPYESRRQNLSFSRHTLFPFIFDLSHTLNQNRSKYSWFNPVHFTLTIYLKPLKNLLPQEIFKNWN